jgi:hypothetical protein
VWSNWLAVFDVARQQRKEGSRVHYVHARFFPSAVIAVQTVPSRAEHKPDLSSKRESERDCAGEDQQQQLITGESDTE